MRVLYSLMLYLSLPWVLLRLWGRGVRIPGYRRHWAERLGRSEAPTGALCIHAVSVGEVRAAQPLVEALRRRWPQTPLVITTTTPTGRETAGGLFGPGLRCVYLPYDLPGAVNRFVGRLSPIAFLVMETEIWPNLYRALEARGIPLLLANARLSARSERGYRRFGGLMRSTLRCVRWICAQSRQDARRFIDLGARPQRVIVAGNLKFDASLPAGFSARVSAIRARLAAQRSIWAAGSTHSGEEMQVLAAHTRILQRFEDALLLLAPRHPERGGELARLCERARLACRLYSDMQPVQDGVQVLIVDTLGELAALYGAADAAFVGGSLVARGGHNPIEALLAGTPVLSGPHVGNFQAVYEELMHHGAVQEVGNEADLAARLIDWLGNPERRRSCAAAGQRVIERHRGAAENIVRCLETVLSD
ncbi:MAG: lipid IV(A) 3-deoxy-D-manno-octulosonic acid transferase [Gammaproteobacteria bacterium]